MIQPARASHHSQERTLMAPGFLPALTSLQPSSLLPTNSTGCAFSRLSAGMEPYTPCLPLNPVSHCSSPRPVHVTAQVKCQPAPAVACTQHERLLETATTRTPLATVLLTLLTEMLPVIRMIPEKDKNVNYYPLNEWVFF